MKTKTEMNGEDARLAFVKVQGRIEEVTETRRITTNLPLALIIAAKVGREVREPEVRAEFAKLPATVFDITHVDNILLLARATWHARHMLLNASVDESRAVLDEAVLSEAVALKQRMFKVLEYWLGHEESMRRVLDSIREGTGHQDLADDLGRLAQPYQEHQALLAQDPLHYRADDAERAQAMSVQIMDELAGGRDSEAEQWRQRVRASWTLLLEAYEEVAAAGRFLFRDEDPDERFPSLFTAGRRRPRPSSADEPGDESLPAGPETVNPDAADPETEAA